ncbi:MAG: hypothetical protein SGI77_26250 [Pirellulaceae bacterium]|nr:hypothetical protein [Pirellulaceae bacterium]
MSCELSLAADNMRTEGSSSRDSREKALRSIPLANLTPQAIAKMRPVLDDPTIFRRMPTQTIVCEPEMFTFIVRHPEVLVEIWELMGMTRVAIDRTGPFSFQGEDGAGTTCRAELILGSDRLHIYYSDGDYEGGLINRKLVGRVVVAIHSQPATGNEGQALVTASMDIFLKLDNIGADLIAKTISPLVVKTADYNYIESLRFVSQLSTAAQRNPSAVEQLALRLDKLKPDIRNQFIEIANRSAARREQLIAARPQRINPSIDEDSIQIGSPMPTTMPAQESLTDLPSFDEKPAENRQRIPPANVTR